MRALTLATGAVVKDMTTCTPEAAPALPCRLIKVDPTAAVVTGSRREKHLGDLSAMHNGEDGIHGKQKCERIGDTAKEEEDDA